ncbi:hypothetical protein [Sphingomonas sp.]|jgi:hypothetical protein|uniref:hypothetical protein n=1 Tax=Sphingomonas sp. TaxID=28214 RepID=UPI002D8069EF|nr:hypothetical protein [Sphingomonas sp.]HEU0042974.1 hypothetical protein [Sphingomonas sp.]
MGSVTYIDEHREFAEAFSELAGILDRACAGSLSDRKLAQRYTDCRQTLIGQHERSSVPGFVVQCVSLYRFVEFITLYHPDISQRRAFIARELGRPPAKRATARGIDIFDAPL